MPRVHPGYRLSHVLTRREYLRAVAILGVMLVIALNRRYVPYWLRPEFYQMEKAHREAYAQLADKRIEVEGRPHLVVGDSMVVGCPWPDADVLSLPGGSPEQVAKLFARHLGEFRYETIVIWVGTAGANEIIAALPGMVAEAEDYTDRVVVLGPMPHDSAPTWFPKEALWLPLPQPSAARVLRRLARRLPSAQVLSPEPLLADATNSLDGLHLTSQGFAALRALLVDAGAFPA